uniref:E-selectin n=1 Tax=Cairina moschata TaxID=8855 RepID=A0A8C3BF22_CAIMO
MTCLWFLSLLAYGKCVSTFCHLFVPGLTILEGVNCWIYFYSNANETYDGAEKWCQNHHAKLVAIQNKSINGYLNEALPFNPGYYWIGIRKINSIWTWVGTNEPLREEKNWATGEPNGNGNNEDCVEIYIKRDRDAGKWNDEKCDKPKVALCYRASCNESTCSGNGQCNEGFNNYTCECNPGFYGRNCELGKVVSSFFPVGEMSSAYNLSCTVWCEKGYELTKLEPVYSVQCEALTYPEKGSMVCSPDTKIFTYNTSCHFTCSEGLKLSGSHVLKCNSSGNWSASLPTCEGTLSMNRHTKVSLGF